MGSTMGTQPCYIYLSVYRSIGLSVQPEEYQLSTNVVLECIKFRCAIR